jgi:hypothetical protein
VEAGPPIDRSKRARAPSKSVRLFLTSPSSSSSSSSSDPVVEEPPAKRKKPASKGKGKARDRDSEAASALRRSLKELEGTIRSQQSTLNTMLVTVARAQDRLRELVDA